MHINQKHWLIDKFIGLEIFAKALFLKQWQKLKQHDFTMKQ